MESKRVTIKEANPKETGLQVRLYDREFERYVEAFSQFEKQAPELRDLHTRALVFNHLWEHKGFDKKYSKLNQAKIPRVPSAEERQMYDFQDIRRRAEQGCTLSARETMVLLDMISEARAATATLERESSIFLPRDGLDSYIGSRLHGYRNPGPGLLGSIGYPL